METTWNITLRVYRWKTNKDAHYDEYKLEVSPDEYVLDAIERIWAFQDRTLCFAHACHHSTCGACGMRINDRERLTCITPISTVTSNGGTVKVEPLRNFPIISDLVVDLGGLYRKNELVGQRPVISVADEPASSGLSRAERETRREFIRLADCIECGLCVSACPAAATSADYLGPAGLAGAHQHGLDGNKELRKLVDSSEGLWRCHSAYECSSVCPSNVDPAGRIMALRRQVMVDRIKGIFRRN